MCYVVRLESRGQVRFCLRKLDKREKVDHKYFKAIEQAREHAKKLGLEVLN